MGARDGQTNAEAFVKFVRTIEDYLDEDDPRTGGDASSESQIDPVASGPMSVKEIAGNNPGISKEDAFYLHVERARSRGETPLSQAAFYQYWNEK